MFISLFSRDFTSESMCHVVVAKVRRIDPIEKVEVTFSLLLLYQEERINADRHIKIFRQRWRFESQNNQKRTANQQGQPGGLAWRTGDQGMAAAVNR